jgi:hypothetical protein
MLGELLTQIFKIQYLMALVCNPVATANDHLCAKTRERERERERISALLTVRLEGPTHTAHILLRSRVNELPVQLNMIA